MRGKVAVKGEETVRTAWRSESEEGSVRVLRVKASYTGIGKNIHDIGEKSLNRSFCKEIATSFSSSSKNVGKAPVSWEQVQKWFQKKHKESTHQVISSPDVLNLVVDLSDKSKSLVTPKGIQVADLPELAFESRSSKDLAWHDVAMFLNYRVLSTGQLEVRVRYAGFGKDEDEWVMNVRERSIPLEPSECHKLEEGHLVLCFLNPSGEAAFDLGEKFMSC